MESGYGTRYSYAVFFSACQFISLAFIIPHQNTFVNIMYRWLYNYVLFVNINIGPNKCKTFGNNSEHLQALLGTSLSKS